MSHRIRITIAAVATALFIGALTTAGITTHHQTATVAAPAAKTTPIVVHRTERRVVVENVKPQVPNGQLRRPQQASRAAVATSSRTPRPAAQPQLAPQPAAPAPRARHYEGERRERDDHGQGEDAYQQRHHESDDGGSDD